jgi:hypothetical protein
MDLVAGTHNAPRVSGSCYEPTHQFNISARTDPLEAGIQQLEEELLVSRVITGGAFQTLDFTADGC